MIFDEKQKSSNAESCCVSMEYNIHLIDRYDYFSFNSVSHESENRTKWIGEKKKQKFNSHLWC